MNYKDTNQEMRFNKFSECDYNLHWSFSNFNRFLMVAGRIAQLPEKSKVLELGAGLSELENIVKKNFKREDIIFYKIDGNEKYEKNKKIDVALDITSPICDAWCKAWGTFDAIIFTEVIEHLDKNIASQMFNKISSWLVPEGLLLFTTPTPPYDGMYEDRVWPTDHDNEFTHSEIYGIINKEFKINKQIGWSLEEREYNELLESDSNLSMIASKLREAFPESYIRAIIACLSPIKANRQILMICKKRRINNGRFTSTR